MALDFSRMSDAELDAFIDTGWNASTSGTPPVKQNTGIGGDTWTGLKQGAAATVSAIPDLASIPFAMAGMPKDYLPSTGWEKMGEMTGFQPGKWAEELGAQKSQALQQSWRDVGQAWDEGGAGNIAGTVATNPRIVPDLISQSLPAMIGGGVLGRGIKAMGASPMFAVGAGEGAITAGMMMNELGDNMDPQRAALFSALGGLGTGLIGAGSARAAKSMNLPDVESAIVGATGKIDPRQALQYAMTAPQAVGVSMLREGLLEEFPQSAQEQIMRNLAEGKPWQEGVMRSGVEGALAGAPMGGLMGGYSHLQNRAVQTDYIQQLEDRGFLPSDARTSTDLLSAYDRYEDVGKAQTNLWGDAQTLNALYDEAGVPQERQMYQRPEQFAGVAIPQYQPVDLFGERTQLTGEVGPTAMQDRAIPDTSDLNNFISVGQQLTAAWEHAHMTGDTDAVARLEPLMREHIADQASRGFGRQPIDQHVPDRQWAPQATMQPELPGIEPVVSPVTPHPPLDLVTPQAPAAPAATQGAKPNVAQAAKAVQGQPQKAPAPAAPVAGDTGSVAAGQAAASPAANTDDVSDAEIEAAIAETKRDPLHVEAVSTPGAVSGKVTMNQQVLQAIARTIAQPKENSGSGVVYQKGTATPDPAHADKTAKVREVAGLAKNVVNAFTALASLDANIIPSAPTLVAKRQSVKAPETTAADFATARQAVATALNAYREAIATEFGGTDMDAQAILAVFKNRVLKVKQKDAAKAKHDTKTDYSLSRVWTMYKNGEFDVGGPLVRNTPVRASWEMAKRGEVSPLEAAAENGYARRPKNAPAHTGLRGVLAYIQRHGNTVERMLAAAIDNALSTVPVARMPKIEFVDNDGKVKSHFKNDAKGGKVTLRRDQLTPEVAIHEALHAGLMWFVLSHPSHPSVTRLTKALSAAISNKDVTSKSPAVEQVLKVLRDVLTKKGDKAAVLEFISYGLTNRDFFQWLKTQGAIGGSESQARGYNASLMKGGALAGKALEMVQDLWNAFRKIIARLITGKENMAGEVFDQTMRLLEGAMYAKAPEGKVENKGSLDFNPSPKYQRIAEFWSAITSKAASNMFRIGRMDESRGYPQTPFTLAQIVAEHLPKSKGWEVEEMSGDTVDITRAKSKIPLVRQWHFIAPGGKGFAIMSEDENGNIALDTSEMTSGESEGWRTLQVALAYSFYNDKKFVGEFAQQPVSDAAKVRYIEAMSSAALKFGSTDFIAPSGPFMKSALSLGHPGLSGWMPASMDTDFSERYTNNLTLLTKAAYGMAVHANPNLRHITFDVDNGFTYALDFQKFKVGEKAVGLSTTEMRAVIAHNLTQMGDKAYAKLMGRAALADNEDTTKFGLEGILYHDLTATEAVQQAIDSPEVDLRVHTQKPALFQRYFEWLGYDGKAINAKLKAKTGKMRTALENFYPPAAGFMSLIDSAFNINADIAKIIDDAKARRKIPIGVVNTFVNDLEGMKTVDEVVAAMHFLDTGEGDVPAHVQETANSLRDKFTKLVNSLPEGEAATYLQGLKISQALAYVVDAGDTASSGFGAHRLGLVVGSMTDKPSISNVLSPETDGVKSLSGVFRRYQQTNGDYVYIHESLVSTQPAAIQAELEKSPTFKATKNTGKVEGDEPTVTMKGTPTYKDKLSTDGGKTLDQEGLKEVSAAMRNTVAVLSNAAASGEMILRIAARQEKAGGKPYNPNVFDTVDDLLAAYGENGYVEKRLKRVTPMKWGDREQHSKKILQAYRSPATWVQVPDNAAYGELAGKLVRGSVWMAIQDSYNRGNFIDNETYMGLMRIFKKSKTVYNLPTHATNVLTNFSLMHMHNIEFRTVAKAADLMRKRIWSPESLTKQELKLLSAFEDSGAVLADFSTNEIKAVLYDALTDSVAGETEHGLGATLKSLSESHAKKFDGIKALAAKGKHNAEWVDQQITTLYATEDNAFRLAAFMTKMGDLQTIQENGGVSSTWEDKVEEAGFFARKAFLDYDIDSRAVNLARQTVLPFISWTYAIIPVLSKIAIEQPWKLVSLGAAYGAIATILSALSGEGDDDEQRRLRALHGKDEKLLLGAFGPYTNVPLPIGPEGSKIYVPLGKYIPMPLQFKEQPNGSFGNKYWPNSLAPNGPLIAFAAAVMNVDPYTGKKLSPDTDSNMERMGASTKNLLTQMLPGGAIGALLPGTKPTFAPDKGTAGNDPDYLVNALKLFGLPVSAVNESEARVNQSRGIQAIQRDYSIARSKAVKDLSRGKIDSAKYAEQIKAYSDRELADIRDKLGVE